MPVGGGLRLAYSAQTFLQYPRSSFHARQYRGGRQGSLAHPQESRGTPYATLTPSCRKTPFRRNRSHSAVFLPGCAACAACVDRAWSGAGLSFLFSSKDASIARRPRLQWACLRVPATGQSAGDATRLFRATSRRSAANGETVLTAPRCGLFRPMTCAARPNRRTSAAFPSAGYDDAWPAPPRGSERPRILEPGLTLGRAISARFVSLPSQTVARCRKTAKSPRAAAASQSAFDRRPRDLRQATQAPVG